MSAYEAYEPLNVPKPFGKNVWIVDGPEIRMDYGPIHLPFPTRMTVVQPADGGLWIHSPIAPDPALFDAVDALGPARYLIAPNSIHYWYMADWIERYPEAGTFAVADHQTRAKRAFRIDHLLQDGARFKWQDEIDWLLVPGTLVSEAVFRVRDAKVLILTDLIENFEARRVKSRVLRFLMSSFGADGAVPYDLRSTFWPRRKQVRVQIARVLEWDVGKVTLAHGKPYEENAAAELRRAFGWASRFPFA